MRSEEVEAIKKVLLKESEKCRKDKEYANRLLIASGIYNKDGSLNERYKEEETVNISEISKKERIEYEIAVLKEKMKIVYEELCSNSIFGIKINIIDVNVLDTIDVRKGMAIELENGIVIRPEKERCFYFPSYFTFDRLLQEEKSKQTNILKEHISFCNEVLPFLEKTDEVLQWTKEMFDKYKEKFVPLEMELLNLSSQLFTYDTTIEEWQ